MHIAVLVTNTDNSDFAARHPRDAEKFTALIRSVRPDWAVTAYDTTEGEFPADPASFDGLLIGGSPASVNDEAHWIGRLFDLIREAHGKAVPMVGACFGHQAIAQALGGRVAHNAGPFILGTSVTHFSKRAPWMPDDADQVTLAAAHGEQVTDLPPGAEVLGASESCLVAAYRIGDTVFATQHHPEMTPAFIAALVEEFAPDLPPEVGSKARASLARPVEGARFGEWIAQFYERAASRSIAVT